MKVVLASPEGARVQSRPATVTGKRTVAASTFENTAREVTGPSQQELKLRMNSNQRPLSPHLQIYRPQWTSVLSILHRASGVALSFGTILMVVWLAALARGDAAFESTLALFSHPVVLIALVGWTLALFYHLLNGIRHLLWDTGMLYDLKSARASGWLMAVLALVLTAIVWGGLA